jgi:hypothetical protein
MTVIDGKIHYGGYSQITAQQVSDYLGKTLTTQEQSIVSSTITSIETFLALKCRRNFKYDLGTDVCYEEIFDAGNIVILFTIIQLTKLMLFTLIIIKYMIGMVQIIYMNYLEIFLFTMIILFLKHSLLNHPSITKNHLKFTTKLKNFGGMMFYRL